MFSPDLVDKRVAFAAASAAGSCFCWSRCPFSVISDSGRYFEICFYMSPVHVEKDTSLIAWSRVHWLVSRGSDGKKLLSFSAVLGDMIWGAMAPLVYCGCISVAT